MLHNRLEYFSNMIILMTNTTKSNHVTAASTQVTHNAYSQWKAEVLVITNLELYSHRAAYCHGLHLITYYFLHLNFQVIFRVLVCD